MCIYFPFAATTATTTMIFFKWKISSVFQSTSFFPFEKRYYFQNTTRFDEFSRLWGDRGYDSKTAVTTMVTHNRYNRRPQNGAIHSYNYNIGFWRGSFTRDVYRHETQLYLSKLISYVKTVSEICNRFFELF